MSFHEIIDKIEPANRSLEKDARHKIDLKTKPQGSLGILEEIAVRMAVIKNSLNPCVKEKALFVFAGDHGITQEGVSAFPSEVTPQMVLNFLNGGAAINVLCRHYHIGMKVVDMGVNFDFIRTDGLIDKKVRKGTRNFLKEDAMTREEADISVRNGMDVLLEYKKDHQLDIVGAGEMGIGNTTSASAIISAVTGLPPEKLTGRGTGVDDEGFKKKVTVIRQALILRRPDPADGFDILKKVGGYEIGGITGMILAAASEKIPVVLDGLISTAGGLLACLIKPATADYLFAGHQSVEQGQKSALDKMGLKPIIDLNMRLGEGTGAALAMSIIDASCKILCEMASFESAGVSEKV